MARNLQSALAVLVSAVLKGNKNVLYFFRPITDSCLSNMLVAKRNLLSLLGHRNFAMRLIPKVTLSLAVHSSIHYNYTPTGAVVIHGHACLL